MHKSYQYFGIFKILPKKAHWFYCLVFLPIVILSCNKDEVPREVIEMPEAPINEIPQPISLKPIYKGETGQVWIYDPGKIDSGYILVNDATSQRAYLMDKEANVLYEWELPAGLGNDAELLPDGKLLVALQDENASYTIGGYGGRVQLINPDRSIAWDIKYSSEDHLSHHDVEMLPNGNILLLAWQKKTRLEALDSGYDGIPDNEILLPESLIEINPLTNGIIWEWHSWDHLIQDFDDTKANYGNVSKNPHLININYRDDNRGDIMHANGIDYDSTNDLIYLSVLFYSEVWVIDHSTTTTEAASNSGGTYGKGGDLVYRFGNPTAYKSNIGGRLFFGNHFPNILLNNEIGAGNMLIYMNGNNGLEQSKVYELDLPDDYKLLPEPNFQPLIKWEFTDKELFSPIVSGAVRLPNGNTLIAQGSYGYWEVTQQGKVVWKFEGNGLFWRGYSYPRDSSPIQLLGLDY